MAKQLNVNLSFTADTAKAKSQLEDLQKALTKITQNVGSTSPLGLTKDISSAVQKATDLQVALQKATSSTGKLDLGQFNQELKKANLNAETIKNSLTSLGPEGQAAFAQLAQAVSLAEVPIKRTNGLLQEFATTLKNTARWQLSSSILHGFMGSLQKAYGYAQDLNKSLNDIRIVTGQTTDQMAEFAKKANESAKALSATTTAYTDAALIFYQQGLTGDAITERTDAVIKMSNVTGQSVEDVSSYMTAIWNNFDDGSQSLEHYADVITALGAATAASSEEIANGLEKFAAIGQTVGLSYDYATSALATVVAATRQSEDVVGTAFKTIFSRIQGLQLGETLEDDVDLNKYSKALKAVGVEVIDATGEMRALDNILDDLAIKWDNLTSAQQTALAQTVAGTRQYAQFIALMSNWDFMERNLEVARNSEGALQEQADIYAQSWEAAQKRVKAAWQQIYGQLLDDKFFVSLTDNIGKALEQLGKFMDALGGIKGILPALSTVLLSVFGKDLSNSINNAIYNLQTFNKTGQKTIDELKQQFSNALISTTPGGDVEASARAETYASLGAIQDSLLAKTRELNEQGKELTKNEQLQVNLLQDQLKILGDKYIKESENLKTLQEENNTLLSRINLENNGTLSDNTLKNFERVGELQSQYSLLVQLAKEFNEASDISKNSQAIEALEKIKEQLENIAPKMSDVIELVEGFKNIDSPEALQKQFELLEKGIFRASEAALKWEEIIEEAGGTNTALGKKIQQLRDNYNEIGLAQERVSKSASNLKQTTEGVGKSIDNLKGTLPDFGTFVVDAARGISSLTMAINSLASLGNIWNNEDLSVGEKFLQTTMSLSMAIPGLVSGIKALTKVQTFLTTSTKDLVLVNEKEIATEVIKQIIDVKKGKISKEKIAAILDEAAARKINIGTEITETMAEEISLALKEKGIPVSATTTKGILEEATAHGANTTAIWGEVVARKALDGVKKAGKALMGGLTKAIAFFTTGVGAAVAGITLGLAAIKIGIDLYKKDLKKTAEASLNTANASKELTDKLKEEKEALSNINKLMADSSLSTEELHDNIISLVDAYDNQRLKILALKGDYEGLTQAIKEEQKEQNEALLTSSQKDKQNYQESIEAGIKASAANNKEYNHRMDEFGTSIDLKGMTFGGTNKREREFAEELSKLGLGISASGQLSLKDFTDALLENQDAIKEILSKYGELDAAKQLSSYITENADALSGYAESIETFKELNLEASFNEHFNKNISSIQEYKTLINNIKADVGEDFSIEEIEDWVEKAVRGIEEVSKYAQASQIARYILPDIDVTEDKGKEVLNKLAEQIKDFSNSKQSWIALHPYIVRDLIGESGEYIEKLSDIDKFASSQIAYSGAKSQVDQSLSLLSEYASKGEFSKGARDTAVGLGIDNANLLSDEELLASLRAFYDKALIETNNYYDAAHKEAEDYIQKITAEENQIQDINIKSIIDETLSSKKTAPFDFEADKLRKEFVEIFGEDEEVRIKNISEALDNIISDEADGKIDKFSKELDILNAYLGEDIVEALKKGRSEYNNYQKKLDEAENAITSITKEQKNWDIELQTVEAEIKNVNKNIDNLQSAYKTITSAQKEYADNGYYTIDSIQSLLDLEPKYLQYLKIDGNQIILNTKGVEDQQQAYYDLLEAKYADYYQTQLDIILGPDDVNGTRSKTLALYEEATAQNLVNGTLDDFIIRCEQAIKVNPEMEKALRNLASTARKTADIINLGRGSISKDIANSSKTGSNKDTKELKKYFDEFDRFYPITKAIEDVTDALSDLDKYQEHLSGQNLINSLAKENKLLQQQSGLYENLLSEQEKYRNELAGTLQYFGTTFDMSTGNITNYAEVTQAALDKYNEALIAYNKSAQNDMAKKALENAEREYNDFKDYLSKYQSILTSIEDTRNNLDDIYYKQIENNLKSFEVDIKLNLDVEEVQRKVNNFIKTINNDFKKLYKTTKEWTNLFDLTKKNVQTYVEDNGTLATNINALRQVAEIVNDANYDYRSANSMFGDRTEAIEKYRELADAVMADGQELYSLYENAWSQYLDAIDEAKDQWDDIIKGFDRVNKTLDHYTKVIELLYGGSDIAAGREYLDKLYDASTSNSLMKQDTLRKEIEALRKEYDEILAIGGENTEQDLNKLTEAIQDAEDELESEIESYLETIQNRLINSIKSIMDSADKAMTGGNGIAKISERWQDAEAAADGYYDEIQRVYQLESLQTKWEKAIDSTNSLKNQKYLTTLMNTQLENLREKTTLSEYDVELAEKQLMVYQAQIALEDAQNNKNSMKLVRNEQGNWAYQYVADPEEVKDKEQDLTDALYDRYNFVKTSSQEATEALMEMYQTAQDRLQTLMEEYTNADEARRAEIREEYDYLYNYYYGPDGLIIQKASETAAMQDDLNVAAMETLWGLYEIDQENFDLMTQTEQDLLNSLKEFGINSFQELTTAVAGDQGFYDQIKEKCRLTNDENKTSWQQLADSIVENWATNPDSVYNTINNAYDSIIEKVGIYDDAIKASEEASGQSWAHVEQQLINVGFQEDIVKQKVDAITESTDALDSFREAVEEIGNAWYGVRDALNATGNSLVEYTKKLREASNVAEKIKNPLDPNGTYTPDTGQGSGNGDNSGYSQIPPNENNEKGPWEIKDMNTGSVNGSFNTYSDALSYITALGGTVISIDYNTKTIIYTAPATQIYKAHMAVAGGNPDDGAHGRVAQAMDTGGYTGDWNSSEGRLAVLHEKELVLNKEDTENILSATQIMRSIVSNIGGALSNYISGGLGNLTSSIAGLGSNLISGGVTNTSNTSSNNTFNITAEFPNANNVDDIREAILSLPTLASQYLSQK